MLECAATQAHTRHNLDCLPAANPQGTVYVCISSCKPMKLQQAFAILDLHAHAHKTHQASILDTIFQCICQWGCMILSHAFVT